MTKTIKIEGMSCMHCAGAVKKELEKLDGVVKAVVDLNGKKAVVEISGGLITDDILRAAVDEAGYKATAVS